MAHGLPIRTDVASPLELRRFAKREPRRRTAQRMLAIANALEGMPPYCPDLNPVERIWLYLRERFLSHRLLANLDAVMDACCHAWNALAADPNRVRSLTAYPYLRQVNA